MVDFPQPDGPTIAVNPPLLIVSDKSLKTSKEASICFHIHERRFLYQYAYR